MTTFDYNIQLGYRKLGDTERPTSGLVVCAVYLSKESRSDDARYSWIRYLADCPSLLRNAAIYLSICGLAKCPHL